MAAGYCVAASFAAITSGLVFDETEDKVLSLDEAIEIAKLHCRAIEKDTPGTRPADIKRYLKPLLDERDDLALIGRALLIRPVRHILRGAFLDRTDERIYSRHPMTEEQLSVCRFPVPSIGDFEILLRRVAAYLPGVGLDADLAEREDGTDSRRPARPAFDAFEAI